MNNVPIVRLELEGLRMGILHCFNDHVGEIRELIGEAVDRLTTPEHLKSVIDTQARQCIDKAIRDEIESFYSYGAGRAVVRAAVAKGIEQRAKEMRGYFKPVRVRKPKATISEGTV